MSERKCVICGFSFPSNVMRYLKKCFWCPECWTERVKRLKVWREQSDREFMDDCRKALKGGV